VVQTFAVDRYVSLTRVQKLGWDDAAWSHRRYRGAMSQGKASVSCWESHTCVRFSLRPKVNDFRPVRVKHDVGIEDQDNEHVDRRRVWQVVCRKLRLVQDGLRASWQIPLEGGLAGKARPRRGWQSSSGGSVRFSAFLWDCSERLIAIASACENPCDAVRSRSLV
jgi:hypothetical protein